MKWTSILFILFLLGLGSCSKKSGAPAAPLTVVGKAFNAASDSIQTTGNSISVSAFRKQSLTQRANCTFDPVTDNAQTLADYLGCVLTVNSQSPETALGAMELVSQIMTKVEQTGVSFAYNETDTFHENISVTIVTTETTPAILSIREKAVTGAWDYQIDICPTAFGDANDDGVADPTGVTTVAQCEATDFFFTIFIKDSDNQLGFKTVQRGDLPNIETVSFLIDSNTNVMRFETWSTGNGNHTRLVVNGTVSATFDLSAITSVAMASAIANTDTSGILINDGAMTGIAAIYGTYDGSKICMNVIAPATVTDRDEELGSDCMGVFPVYNSQFHAFHSQRTLLSDFADDETKGILNFTADSLGFAIGSFFINN